MIKMPSCLSCEHSRPYAPKCKRSVVRYRCEIFMHDVDASTVPGRTIGCDRFRAPEVPFGFEDDMPVWLL